MAQKRAGVRRAVSGAARGAGGPLRARLEALAGNLWWTWNSEPTRLLSSLDPREWEAVDHNPLRLFERISDARWEQLRADAAFLARLRDCETQSAAYFKTRAWFERTARGHDRNLLVAYFSAEFGIHESLPQYAGGLGVLAGDHLKSASDLGVPLVGIGLLYRSGYFQQSFAPDGASRTLYPQHDFERFPLENTGKTVTVSLGRTPLHARVWRARVGRTPLLLLDADFDRNPPRLRELTAQLYGGDSDTRIEQEILLGMGGVRALEALGYKPTVFHLNEGHAAFASLERLRGLCKPRGGFERALVEVRNSTVFTTHTPVPAGHDRFSIDQMTRCFSALPGELGLVREDFLALGREDRNDRREPFCMTVLALRTSARCNGVAALHGETSRRMWTRVYNTGRPEDVPIGHVTNGVHTQTWLAPEMEPMYRKYLRARWTGAAPTEDWWSAADRIPPAQLWDTRKLLRSRMVHFVRQRLLEEAARRSATAEDIAAVYETFSEDALTIGFARRFATYKRAPLIFHNVRRLAAILGDPKQPVQIIFAGKAHPRDLPGQAFAQQIYQLSRQAAFRGRVVLLENYDMSVGRALTSGCDVWLNNPIRPQEASGTSGMKPPLHGGLNLSILDGWWPEAFDGTNGWAIGGQQFSDRKRQDKHDAESIYDLLEREVVPLFYQRGADGVPLGWVKRMVASMKTICAKFSAQRMVGEYTRNYYLPAHRAGRRR